MNIESEILGFQLRIRELEAASRVHRDQVTALSCLAATRAELIEVRAEIGRDFLPLNVAVARLRWDTEDKLRTTLSEALARVDNVRSELVDLGLRLDRLLEKDGA